MSVLFVIDAKAVPTFTYLLGVDPGFFQGGGVGGSVGMSPYRESGKF